MKKNKLIIVLTAALMFGLAGIVCIKNDASVPKDTYGIIIKGYSALRIEPMIYASVVMYLNKGESVEVMERSKDKNWVGKIHDSWYRIRTRDGNTGWVFGENIVIHTSENRVKIDKLASDFMAEEATQIKKYLAGKWWSVNKFGDFTNHCLEIYESNKYRSYMKGRENQAIAGTYRIDFNKNEIIFDQGTSFKSNLDLVKRGNQYEITKKRADREVRFAKISLELPPEPVLATQEKAIKP
jgi:hypothetical protein